MNEPSSFTASVPTEGTGWPTTVRVRFSGHSSFSKMLWARGMTHWRPNRQGYKSSRATGAPGGVTFMYTHTSVKAKPSVTLTQKEVLPGVDGSVDEESVWMFLCVYVCVCV